MKLHHLFFFILIGFGWQCKKDKDNNAPVVTIFSPDENQTYSIGETIHVKFKVEDETKIEFAQVAVSDENGIQVLSTVTFHDLNTNDVMEADLLIDNSNLITGVYNIASLCSDGKNEKNACRTVIIKELRLRRRAIYISCASTSQTSVYKLDSTNSLSYAFGLSGDFIGSAIDSKSNRLISCGAYTGKLKATKLTDFTEAWGENPVGVTYPCYRNLSSSNGLFIVSYSNGNIKGFDYSGAQKYSAFASQGVYYPIKSALSTNYLLCEQATFLAGTKKLVLYTYPAGSGKQEMNFSGDVVDLFAKDANDFFVFYNQGSTGKISLYSSAGNGFSYYYPYPISGKINSVVAINSSVYLVATNDGIFQYTYETQNFTLFKAGIVAHKLSYDASSNEVLACEGKTLHFYELNTAMQVNTCTTNDSIVDFQLQYNR